MSKTYCQQGFQRSLRPTLMAQNIVINSGGLGVVTPQILGWGHGVSMKYYYIL